MRQPLPSESDAICKERKRLLTVAGKRHPHPQAQPPEQVGPLLHEPGPTEGVPGAKNRHPEAHGDGSCVLPDRQSYSAGYRQTCRHRPLIRSSSGTALGQDHFPVRPEGRSASIKKKGGPKAARFLAANKPSAYSTISATMPAPTVRPPSRMAKRRRSSMAIGTISSTSTVMLSPGITISVPAGSVTIPVTSVVRK